MSAKKSAAKKPAAKRKSPIPRENVFQDGPHLIAAIVCEKILEEKDGVKTAVRIVDRFTRKVVVPEGEDSQTIPPMQLDLHLLLSFKRGNASRKHELGLELTDPVGTTLTTITQTIEFEGGADRGIEAVINFRASFERDGIYWMNVFMDEWRVTRIPLRAIFIIQKQGAGLYKQGPVS